MNIKKKLEQVLFYIDELDTRHHKRALALKIGLWIIAPFEMGCFTLTKRAYRRYVK